MYDLYFKMDIFKKEVYFFSVSSPSDKKLIHTYTFDDIMYMADDYFTGNYENKLQGLYNLMMKQIDVEENQDVQDLEKRLETEFDGNIFAEICLNVLYGTYQKQKDNMIHLGIINSLIDTVSQKFTLQTKSKIESTFKAITNSMNKLSEYADNDFRYTSEIIFK